ncbi:MAG TPA: DUF2911 domain-containing protein [Thermoanaerobaculia bacterium]|nr:DUF2911 domain-containing protein [Thermoanaerobaculia bacterium]
MTHRTVRNTGWLCLSASLLLAGATLAQPPAATPPATAGTAAPTAQDDPTRRPSPMAMARTTLGEAYLRVVYCRPGKRGRDNIFGTAEAKALVPYGTIWRTGANEATELTVTRDVLIGGQRLAAGNYSLFTTPGPDRWKLHINSGLGQWGSRDYDAAKDVLVLEAVPTALAQEVEWFTIAFEPHDPGTDLVLRWVTTEVRVPIRLP